MITRDLHTHTTYCDGRNTPEEMVCAAIQKGLTTIGFSGHSYSPFEPASGMTEAVAGVYRAEIQKLKEKYAGQIQILCGIEQDYYSDPITADYDYIIGSVHFLCVDGQYTAVDLSAEVMQGAIDEYFAGDPYAYAERYFETVGDVVEKTGADIIGHFDLLTKFNQKKPIFDTAHPRYRAAWQKAVDRLLPYGKPFEINTGAISRGYTDFPYPSGEILQYIKQRGGAFLLSSDSHRKDTLCFEFEKWESLLDGRTKG